MEDTSQRQLDTMIEYLESIPEPTSSWPPGLFEDNSYSRWAVNYMIALVLAQPEKTPARVVMEFEELMERYSGIANCDWNGRDIVMIFDVAWREAVNISDILRAMG